MATSGSRKHALALLCLCAVAFVSFAVGHWWFPLTAPASLSAEDEKELAPTCRIVLLPPQERIDRMNAPVVLPLPARVEWHGPVRPPHTVPPEHADNPVLLHDHFAVARFENTTGRPLTLYVVRWIGGLGYEPLPENTAVVDYEVSDAAGKPVEEPPAMWMSLAAPKVPSAAHLRRNNNPLFVLHPGDHIDFPMSILGLTTPKPMTYTVRTVVSYAEGPDGKTKRVTSNPVTMTVTPDHIKTAQAYWKSR